MSVLPAPGDPTTDPGDRDAANPAAGSATGSADTGATPPDEPGMPTVRRRVSARTAVDVGLLLLAPVVAFLLLRVRPMTDQGLVDSWLYTGYQLNGPDLIRRFGAGVYYWVRLGTTVPERASSLAFGPVPGFFVLRYLLALLATVPLFVVVRGAAGRATAWAAVAAVLVSPVTWNAWGTDYPDALIFSYLIGGAALLALPLQGRWSRAAAVAGAGLTLSLAVHSQVVVAPLVAVIVVVHLVVTRRGWRSAARTSAGLLAALLVVTAALIGISHLWLGLDNIFKPTIDQYRLLQQPDQLPMWHSESRRWIVYTPSTVVPYLIVVAWGLLAIRDRRRMDRVEAAFGLTALASAAVWWLLQFLGTVATLEYRLYVSALWALALPVLGLVVARLCGPGRRRWAGVVVVVLAGLALSFVRLDPAVGIDLGRVRWVALASLVLVVAVVVGAFVRRRAVVGVTCAVLVAAVAAGITVLPSHKPDRPQQFTPLPQPQYGEVFGALGDREFLRSYGIAAQLPGVIGPGGTGQQPLFWSAPDLGGQTPSDLSATYLWHFMPYGLPSESSRQAVVDQAWAQRPAPLVIVTRSDAQSAQYAATWARSGHPLRVVRRATLAAFGLQVSVWVAVPVTPSS